jgi:hypothetical protein
MEIAHPATSKYTGLITVSKPKAMTSIESMEEHTESLASYQSHQPFEVILAIMEELADEPGSLKLCRLVNKHILPCATTLLFRDITIRLCPHPNPGGHSSCRQCIGQFVRLVASRYSTIPRTVRTLTLNGKGTGNWMNMWKAVGNAGGMDRSGLVRGMAKHFLAVRHLEMIKVQWFDPPLNSLRTISRFLSSIKSLTLDDCGFYAGPRGLYWMIHQMKNLEELSIPSWRLDWPARHGYFPDNSPDLLVFCVNAGFFVPYVFIPFQRVMMGALKVIEWMRRSVSSYGLQKPLRKLTIHSSMDWNKPWLHWLLAQEEQLSSICTLAVSLNGDEKALEFITMLKSMSSLRRLTIHEATLRNDNVIPIRPTINHQALEYLEIRLLFPSETPQPSVQRTENILRMIQSPSLTVATLAFDLRGEIFNIWFGEKDVPSPVASLDSYLSRIPNLQHVCLDMRLYRAWRLETSEIERLLRRAFRLCEAQRILDLKVVRVS